MSKHDPIAFTGSDLEAVVSGKRNASVGFEELRSFTVGDEVPVLDGESGEEVATVRIGKTGEIPLEYVPATLDAIQARTGDLSIEDYQDLLGPDADGDVDRSTPVRVLVWELVEG